ncbi:MAG: hypothetical protein JOZ32_20220 [Bryobacterales bacterium]|nr:hypothetical protein [Bryobacterales bacterium]
MISLGALGGVRPTDGLSYGDESRPYIVGGSVEVHLPAQFAIEADALYQRIGDTSTFLSINGPVANSFTTRERGNSWEFPLLAKYYFRPHTASWQPFIGTGYSFRTVSFHTDSSSFISGGLNTSSLNLQGDFRAGLSVGASVVAGLRFHYRALAILPQARYTRWGDSNDNINRNEVMLLLGLSF